MLDLDKADTAVELWGENLQADEDYVVDGSSQTVFI